MICRKHLFISATDNVDLDAMLHHVHRILIEGFHNTTDNVVVVPDQQHQSVSVTFKDGWMCRIDLNDNIAQLLLDQENWVQANGSALVEEDRNIIATAFPRLDIFCDPDEEQGFDDEFDAICLYLQLNFAVQYSYDPIQSTFTIHGA
jgi:hypothetical protein